MSAAAEPTYQEAIMANLGRMIAALFRELVSGGMSRDEALEVVCEYVAALARPPERRP